MSVTRKIGVLLFLPALVTILFLAVFQSFFNKTVSHLAATNVAGRQRMLSQESFAYANMVYYGQEEKRDALIGLVHVFDESLRVLEHGGEIMDYTILPAPSEVIYEIDHVKEIWERYKSALLQIAELPAGDRQFQDAYSFVEKNLESLTESSDRVVTAYVLRSRAMRRQIYAPLLIILIFYIFLLIAGMWVMKNYVDERKRSEDELKMERSFEGLLKRVAIAGSEYSSIEDLIQACIDDVCVLIGWPVGHVYIISKTDPELMEPTTLWHLDPPCRFRRFRKVTEETSFPSSVGMPGRIYISRVPTWIVDVTEDPNFPRAEKNKDLGVKACLAFPVIVSARVFAILEFFSEEAMRPDERMLSVMAHVGHQLGRVIERRHMDEELVLYRDHLEEVVRERTSELSASNETLRKLQNAIEQTVEMVIITDSEGVIEYTNPAVKRVTGYSQHELIGQKTSVLKSGLSDGSLYKDLWETVKSGKTWSGDIVNRKKSGELYDEKMTVSPILDDANNITHFVAIKRDVSEEKLLKQQLLQMEKLSSIGTFVSGIAHELNNPLTAIQGFSKLLILNKAMPQDALADLKIIAEQSKRTGEIVKNLLRFSRKQKAGKSPTQIKEIIDTTLALQAYSFKGDNIEVVTDYEENLPLINADINQLQQVVTNIVLNAYHAMINARIKGTIKIKCKREKGNVRVTFQNDGLPIPPDLIKKVFDPFFTTKKEGEGTGLGLYISHEIIEDHKGRLFVENVGDTGVMFTMELPIVIAEVEKLPYKPNLLTRHANGKILIIDDEEPIRLWLTRVLEMHGNSIWVAKDGEEATETLRSEEFDVIISDIKMPGMGGFEFVDWLKKNRPYYLHRLIFLTGMIDMEVKTICKKYECRYLQKPLDKETVLETISEVLNNSE